MNDRLRSLMLVALLALGTALATTSLAQEAPPAASSPQPVLWSSLSPDQQRLLARFGNQWSALPPARQQALAHGSERWLSMSLAERDQATERFARWRALPPEQRQALRQRWQRFQALPPNQRNMLRQDFHRFQQLPPAQQQILREQWSRATPAQRQQMVQHAREQRMKHMPGAHHPSAPHLPHH